MTVHINGSKGKDLYYGGTKIKEAYYNGNKVYSGKHTEIIQVGYSQFFLGGTACITGGFKAGKTYTITLKESHYSGSNTNRQTAEIAYNHYPDVAFAFFYMANSANYVGTSWTFTPTEDINFDTTTDPMQMGGFFYGGSGGGGYLVFEVTW